MNQTSMTPQQRYQQAYNAYQLRTYPSATKDHGTLPVKPCDTKTANGLTRWILNFLTWQGHRATRITSAGRVIKTGNQTSKYIPSGTRRGAADIGATIRGRAVNLEVKVGADKPSEYQLREQAIERAAGGCYEFIHSPEEFIQWYDNFIVSLSNVI